MDINAALKMENLMSLLFVLGLWAFLGGSVYRAHKRARSASDNSATGGVKVQPGRRRERVDIPETVPSEWVDAYRTEHGG